MYGGRVPPQRQRRSLSMPKQPGKIYRDGDSEIAKLCVDALTAAQTDRETAETFTHPFHTYPARLHPATARLLVELVVDGAKKDQPFLDPFCGSGTTLVESRSNGIRTIGSDLNPLAALVARAKTWTAPPRRRTMLREAGHSIAGAALAAGKAARRASSDPAPLRKPKGFDPNSRDRRLAAWFAPHVRRELEDLAARIDELAHDDAEMAGVLLACLSAVLYKVSSRTSDTDATWTERRVGRGQAARLFAQRVDLLVAGLTDLAKVHAPLPEVHELDIRKLETIVPDGSACGIVTSPPYAGTYDYAEHQRLRFDFLALRHREFDTGELGSRRSFEQDPPTARDAWKKALVGFIAKIAATLAPGRRAALVIGDSVAANRAVFALDDLRDALTSDLAIEAWASQERPMLGINEKRAFGDMPKREHVVVLRRS
jgi:DNA modification methylase